ncbi:Rpn family recombination-promoting nuclease/putative transposase [Clostridium tarantellae]|uniref:Rpn family recombination-promoting nuclease/putative transposase n=1 Tax=Clostridium tarantellae TaxID=39493 RepID=A0A6I1MNS6_9CLOT|nr:Rpn family recombination-promoting nuclease/putative transposase [Clostridium tarantellae]MPQ45065.1 Rpn family recombination-promoting nuclease/putative transposase [Clostridium tarantellae]
MTKTLKELNLEDDFLFAKVMSDKEICKEFLEKLLQIEIEKIEMPENQKTIDLLLESKGIRLDIYVKDENNTVYNVEMQRGKHRNLPKRLRYYQGNIDLDLISKGDDYRKLAKSFIIFICTFDLFNAGRHKYTFETVCVEDHTIKLKDDTNKIILNTTGVIKDLSDELIEFLKYIEHSDDKTAEESTGELVKNIHKRVIEVKNNPNVEVEFMTLLERDREKLEEGRAEGIEEGREEGIELTKKVFKLLSKGESIANIAKLCHISEEKVKEILE